jgi:hypothetical protein
VAFRRDLVTAVGGVHSEFARSQYYDLALRIVRSAAIALSLRSTISKSRSRRGTRAPRSNKTLALSASSSISVGWPAVR